MSNCSFKVWSVGLLIYLSVGVYQGSVVSFCVQLSVITFSGDLCHVFVDQINEKEKKVLSIFILANG